MLIQKIDILKTGAYILFFLAVFFISIKAFEEPTYHSFIEIEVNEGDTLWAIARKYSEGKSIQSYVIKVKEYNNLQYDIIYPGQILYVPQLEEIKEQVDEGNYLLSSKY